MSRYDKCEPHSNGVCKQHPWLAYRFCEEDRERDNQRRLNPRPPRRDLRSRLFG